MSQKAKEQTSGFRWLTDLLNKELKDILIVCTDNLRGFSEAIQRVYPKAEIQRCIERQIHNSLKYVASKDQKVFLKKLYRADTKEPAEMTLLNLSEKWGKKYPAVIQNWKNIWKCKLTTYFQYTAPIRKLIYTTNGWRVIIVGSER